MDMVSAACPDCSILLVEIGNQEGEYSDQDFVTGAHTAATLGASATSISIGGPEEGDDPTGYTTPGHLVLAASGDFGYDQEIEGASTPSYPASAPDVVAVNVPPVSGRYKPLVLARGLSTTTRCRRWAGWSWC